MSGSSAKILGRQRSAVLIAVDAAYIPDLLRIGAERPRERLGVRRIGRGDELVGRNTLLDPALQSQDGVVLRIVTPDFPKFTAPTPPAQWFMPATMKSRSNFRTW